MIEQALKAGIPQCVVFVADNCKRKKKNITNCVSPYLLFKINVLIDIHFRCISATTRDVKCDEGWEEFSGHCYYFPDEYKDWKGARVCDIYIYKYVMFVKIQCNSRVSFTA